MAIRGLLVGISYEGSKEWSPLRFTIHDVDGLKSVLIGRWRVHHDDLMVLASDGRDPPHLDNILSTWNMVIRDAKPDDICIFFFSGHGVEVDGIRLIPELCHRELVLRTSIDLRADILDPIEEAAPASRRLLIIDACRDTGTKGEDEFNAGLVKLLEDTKTTAIVACSSGERSREDDALKMGVFSHHLVDALHNQDPTRPDLQLLFDEVRTNVIHYSDGRQTPELIEGANDPLSGVFIPTGSNSERILAILQQHPDGLTDAEMQVKLNMNGNSQRPSRLRLEKKGVVEVIGHRDGHQVWSLVNHDGTRQPSGDEDNRITRLDDYFLMR